MTYPHLYAVTRNDVTRPRSKQLVLCTVAMDLSDVYIEAFELLGYGKRQITVYDIGSIAEVPLSVIGQMLIPEKIATE